MTTRTAIVLPDGYYLRNFETLTAFVLDTYGDLLSADELRWHRDLSAVSEPARRLYIRLLGRRGSLFRLERLRYADVADDTAGLRACAIELAERELVVLDPGSDPAELMAQYTLAELRALLASESQRRQNRAELVTHLLANPDASQLDTLRNASHWLLLGHREKLTVFSLCFFGNLYQDLTEFVLRDLGMSRYESYRIDSETRLFDSRAQIEAHLHYYACDSDWSLLDRADADALLALEASLPSASYDVDLVRRVERLRIAIARQLERLDRDTDALALYAKCHRPPSRERRVRVLARSGDPAAALSLCTEMARVPCNDEELQFTETWLPKLRRLNNERVEKTPRFKPATTRLTLKRDSDRVEQQACAFYQRFGHCHYVENHLVCGVFGLFIWDILFLPVKGVFFNPFQSAPADFRQPEFIERRASELQARFEELDEPLRFSARVWQNYETRQGIANPLVHWSMLGPTLLERALGRIPAMHWRVLFQRLLDDLADNTSGLPDLVLFPEQGGYEFIEVKGPGDALQKNQRRWMAWFHRHQIPYRVVNITWARTDSA